MYDNGHTRPRGNREHKAMLFLLVNLDPKKELFEVGWSMAVLAERQCLCRGCRNLELVCCPTSSAETHCLLTGLRQPGGTEVWVTRIVTGHSLAVGSAVIPELGESALSELKGWNVFFMPF